MSFSSTLTLMGVLDRLSRQRSHVVRDIHSPVLASLPGTRVLEVGAWGMRETDWDDLELVQHWKASAPQRYLRHLLPGGRPARDRLP